MPVHTQFARLFLLYLRHRGHDGLEVGITHDKLEAQGLRTTVAKQFELARQMHAAKHLLTRGGIVFNPPDARQNLDHYRAGAAGGVARRGAAGHQHHARRAAGGPGRRRSRADELVAGHRRRRRPAAHRDRRRARELAVAVRGRGRARRVLLVVACCAGSTSRRCARAAASTCRARSGSRWRWSACCSRSRRASSGAPLPAFALLGAAAVVFGLWGRFELRTRSPMVDLRVSARPAVLWTNVASVLIGFAMFAGFLVTTQVLQAPVATGYGFGLSLVLAGIVLLPIGGAMGVFSPVSARLSARFGARTTLAARHVRAGRRQRGHGADPRHSGARHAGDDRLGDRRRARLLRAAVADHGRRPADGDGRRQQPQHADADAGHVVVQRGGGGRCDRAGRGRRRAHDPRPPRRTPWCSWPRRVRRSWPRSSRRPRRRPSTAAAPVAEVCAARCRQGLRSTRQVLVACAYNRPAASVRRASAKAVRRPQVQDAALAPHRAPCRRRARGGTSR